MSRKLLSTYRKWVRNKGIDSYCIQVFNYLDPIFVAPALAWVTKACKFPSVCSSIRPSVCPSVCLSVRQHLPWVSCERNSSYSFLLIFLKLCRCFLHGVRMCMWFGYNCWIIFYHFFHFVNLVIFRPQCIDSGYLVSATPHTILYQSFWNFAHVFSMVWRCTYGLDIIFAFIFVTFSTLRTLSFSDLRFYENVVTVSTLWAQLHLQFYNDLFETLYMFSPWSGDVHMVWI